MSRRRKHAHRAVGLLDVLRGFSPARTHSRFGRLVATTVAVLITLLLVGSAGPVYADGSGTTADPAAITTSSTSSTGDVTTTTDGSAGPAGTSGTDPSAAPTATASPGAASPSADPTVTSTPSPTPATPTSSTTTSSTTTTTTTTSSSSSGSGSTTSGSGTKSSPMLKTALAAATPTFDCSQTVLVGGFEIDGDTPLDCGGSSDWSTTGLHVTDGAKDHTAYTQGDAENTPATTWHDGGSSQGKDDITDTYGWTTSVNGDVWTLFGIGRVSDNGTTTYDIELNHKANLTNSPVRPDRTLGDLLLQFSVNGNGPLSFDTAYQWTAKADFSGPGCFESGSTGYGWCPLDTVKKPAFESANSPDGLFAEGALNLSALGRANNNLCTGNFGVMNIRTVASEQHTAALQDYVAPFSMHIASTCATLAIQKQDEAGNSLPGATFGISPNPIPGKSGDLVITDAATTSYPGAVADGNADGLVSVDPATPDQTYTVTELAAPPGYFLPATVVQSQYVGKNGSITFTFKDPKQWQDLTVSNTASASYTRTYHWKLEKGVGDTTNGPFSSQHTKRIADAGVDSASFGYQLEAIENGYTDSGWAVHGTVTVENPNPDGVTVDLGDQLSDGTTCAFTDSTVTVPGNSTKDYAYNCAPGDTSVTSSTATVSWSKADYPQKQSDVGQSGSYSKDATTSVAWTEHPVHKSVTITDDQYQLGTDGWHVTYGDGTGPTHTTTYTRDVAGKAGTCTDSTNTATLTADDDSGYTKTASATATVCVGLDLAVAKTAAPTLTRTYDWQVTKQADQAQITTDASGHATAHFTIAVSGAGYTDSNWVMTGAIKVTNPNDWEAVTLTDLTDYYDGGAKDHETCTITDWGSQGPVIPQAGSKTYHYTCTFDQKPSYTGTNTATAAWDGSAAATPDSSASGTVSLGDADWQTAKVHDTADLVDDNASGGSTWTQLNTQPMQWSSGLIRTFDYSMPVTVEPGTCQTFTNQAQVMDGQALLAGPAGAQVTACNPQGLTASKSADATFVRTYHWTLSKKITDPATVHVDSYSHTFDYTVTATPDGYTDGAWALSGTIYVSNPNTDAGIDPITATVTDVPTGVGAGVTCTVNSGENTVTLASGESATLPYDCTFAPGATPTDGTNVAHISWNDGQSSIEATAPVHFSQDGSVDKTVEVWDDQASGTKTLLGEATWGDQPTSFTYQKEFTAPGTACADFTNHAWITAVEGTDHLADASATATICPNPGTWQVVKTSTPADGSTVQPGDPITYHVTVTKTGGVDPTGVVVEDDLSGVVAYTGDPVITAPSGTTASYDPQTRVLTWTIGDLAGSVTLDYTVTVDAGAYGDTLVNHVTSDGSDNCPPAPQEESADCTTSHYTPHYTLTKSSSVLPGGAVMPPYMGAAGDTITYTLTAHNDSLGVVQGATVTDDLSDVLDNASFVDGSIGGDGQGSLTGNTLTWQLPTMQPGDTAVLTYQVTVGAGQWDQRLTNVATPDGEGSCVLDNSEQPLCSTTTVTPPYTQLAVKKVDAETGAALAGATFSLATAADPGTAIDTATSGADGVAVFGTKLQPGDYLVTETVAPSGYGLPSTQDATMPVTIQQPGSGSNFVPDGVMAPLEFRDPAQGQLAIVAKEQYVQAANGSWVRLPDTATVHFGDTIKYVVRVSAAGPKRFHDVTVTDYVPGDNPADTTSTMKGRLVAGSSGCTGGVTCTVNADQATGKVTWSAGTVTGARGAMVMVVKFPDLPASPHFDASGTYTATLWNVGYLTWDEAAASTTPQQGTQLREEQSGAPMVHHELASNAVVASAVYHETLAPPPPPHHNPPPAPPHHNPPPQAAPPPEAPVLPNTGGPQWWYLPVGAGLVILGSGLLLGQETRRRRKV